MVIFLSLAVEDWEIADSSEDGLASSAAGAIWKFQYFKIESWFWLLRKYYKI